MLQGPFVVVWLHKDISSWVKHTVGNQAVYPAIYPASVPWSPLLTHSLKPCDSYWSLILWLFEEDTEEGLLYLPHSL